MDARNLNKSLISNNYPILRQEDIRAQLSGANYFSKLDFKTAFWQLELDQESRALTVFHANDKLYRYTRLIMGIKPAQAELSVAFHPLFSHIPNVYLIHNDLIIATISFDEHLEALREVMEIIKIKNLTLNPKKCIFAAKEIKFWGMIFSSEGVKPDPEKIKAITALEPPKNKEELKSFICMMQSSSDFILCFSKLVAPLRLLLNSKERFNWNSKHQKTFDKLLQEFRKETLLTYFDINKQTFIFTDAHKTGFSAILAQGDSANNSKPVAIVSRSTSKAEQNYAQLDLEALAVDYALRRFRTYLIGSPRENIIINDHLPLLSVFNGKRSGSIRTERIKLRHQDVRYVLEYKKGQENFADHLSRHAIKWKDVSKSDNFSEITVLNNGTLLKQDKIILPAFLIDKALYLAHSGAHPGQNGLIRRLRAHFYIKGLDKIVKDFVQNCKYCQLFTQKTTKHPIEPNQVPKKCWDETSVDLFGPLPRKNHIIVIQDLASRYPVAKVIRSTKAKSVIPVLQDTYNTFGNPKRQKSDKGPPFNSKEMVDFTSKRNIEQVKIPPGHPSANNVETVMKPLGKAMKIGHLQNKNENETLHSFLINYRDTPHLSTGAAHG